MQAKLKPVVWNSLSYQGMAPYGCMKTTLNKPGYWYCKLCDVEIGPLDGMNLTVNEQLHILTDEHKQLVALAKLAK